MKPCVSKELAELAKSWQQKLLNVSILNYSNWQKVGRGGQNIFGGFSVSMPFYEQIETKYTKTNVTLRYETLRYAVFFLALYSGE